MTEPVLRTENLTKRFGGLTAVDNLSLSLPGGRLQAIIGPNGAGKTTFFNLVSGLLRADERPGFLSRARHHRPQAARDQPARHQAHAADQKRVQSAQRRGKSLDHAAGGKQVSSSVPRGLARSRNQGARRPDARADRHDGAGRIGPPERCPTATWRCSKSAWR